jgi:tetratricopeptide (TPR) repeat protein
MYSTARQHVGAGLVAAGMLTAAFAEGLFQPTGYAAASIVIWAVVIAGLLGRALPSAPIAWPAAAAGLCLAGAAALAIASVGWADDQGRAFEEAVRVSFYTGLFALAACTASRVGIREWLGGMTAGLAAVSVLSLLAYLQPGLLTDAGNEIPNAIGRLSYPLGYWNGMAAQFGVTGIVLARGGVEGQTRMLRAAAVALLPVALLGIWLAQSRGGAAAAAIGLAILLAAAPDRPRQAVGLGIGIAAAAVLIGAGEGMDALRNGLGDAAMRADGDRMSALVVGVVLLAGAAAWALDGSGLRLDPPRPVRLGVIAVAGMALVAGAIAVDPAERFQEFKRPPDPATGTAVTAADISSNGRWQFWEAAVDAFEDAPVAGVGAGGYEEYWARNASVPLFVRNPHSLPLQQAAELGSAGIILLLGFIAAIGTAAWARLRGGREGDGGVLIAVIVGAAIGAAVDWTWEIPAAFAPAVICAGLLAASAPRPRLRRDSYWLGAGTVAVAWVAMVAGALVVLAEVELEQSRDAAAANRIGEGIRRAEQARTVMPWSAEPYTQLALLEERRGDIEAALRNLEEAKSRDSEDWRLPLIEARLQARRGDELAARTALQRSRALSPMFDALRPQG